MVKFVALYRRPPDVAAFEKRYTQDHLPLVRQFPDLQRLEVSRITWPREDAPYYLIAELWYADRDTRRASLRSEISQRAAAVLQEIVPPEYVTMLRAEVSSE